MSLLHVQVFWGVWGCRRHLLSACEGCTFPDLHSFALERSAVSQAGHLKVCPSPWWLCDHFRCVQVWLSLDAAMVSVGTFQLCGLVVFTSVGKGQHPQSSCCLCPVLFLFPSGLPSGCVVALPPLGGHGEAGWAGFTCPCNGSQLSAPPSTSVHVLLPLWPTRELLRLVGTTLSPGLAQSTA